VFATGSGLFLNRAFRNDRRRGRECRAACFFPGLMMRRKCFVCLAVIVVLSQVAVAASLDGYTLTGVIHDPGRVSVAILEHADGTFVVVRAGESTELGKVSSIDRHSVIFDRPDERVSMSLEYGVERFAPGGGAIVRTGEKTGSGGEAAASETHDEVVSTEFDVRSKAVAIRGSPGALGALLDGAAAGAGITTINGATTADAASTSSGTSSASSSDGSTGSGSGNGGSGKSGNNAPRELGQAIAEVFDLPPTMEIVQVNSAAVESAKEAMTYIQAEIEIGNTVTLFTHGIPPSNRVYIQPDSPSS
jgi:hypothetical protein